MREAKSRAARAEYRGLLGGGARMEGLRVARWLTPTFPTAWTRELGWGGLSYSTPATLRENEGW